MTLREHRRHYVAPSEQEIPAFNYTRSSEDALGTGRMISLASCTGRILSDSLAQRMSYHSSMMPEVFAAPFKLHKPPPPWPLPSSRCILSAPTKLFEENIRVYCGRSRSSPKTSQYQS
jgi:hypothetical protein